MCSFLQSLTRKGQRSRWLDIIDYSHYESIGKKRDEVVLALLTGFHIASPALGLGMSRSTTCRPAVASSRLNSVRTTARLPPLPVRVSAIAAGSLHVQAQDIFSSCLVPRAHV